MKQILSLWLRRVAVYEYTATKNPKKTPEDTLVSPTLKHPKHEREGRIVVYRSQLNIHEGYLIQGRKRTGKGLTPCHIERIWKDWSWASNIPVLHPRLGRAYLATFEHFVLGKPTSYIQWLLRHDSLQSTEHYLSRIVSYEDMKALFYLGKSGMFQHQTKEESIQ